MLAATQTKCRLEYKYTRWIIPSTGLHRTKVKVSTHYRILYIWNMCCAS